MLKGVKLKLEMKIINCIMDSINFIKNIENIYKFML